MKVKDVIEVIEKIAPVSTQESWDNSGLQIGNEKNKVSKILLVMDVTDDALDYAVENQYSMIVSHHPLFFNDIKSIDHNSYKGRIIYESILNNMTVYTAHTNLDKSSVGTNYTLANLINLEKIEPLTSDEELTIGVKGEFSQDYNKLIDILDKSVVSMNKIIGYGKRINKPSKIAIVGGSGSSLIETVIKQGCDTFITSDIKHHDGQIAYENDLMLIDITHYYSEIPVLKTLKDIIKKELDVEITIYNKNKFNFDIKGAL